MVVYFFPTYMQTDLCIFAPFQCCYAAGQPWCSSAPYIALASPTAHITETITCAKPVITFTDAQLGEATVTQCH
jgi:hypothetical protein